MVYKGNFQWPGPWTPKKVGGRFNIEPKVSRKDRMMYKSNSFTLSHHVAMFILITMCCLKKVGRINVVIVICTF